MNMGWNLFASSSILIDFGGKFSRSMIRSVAASQAVGLARLDVLRPDLVEAV